METKANEPQNVSKDEHKKIYFVERTTDGEIFMMNEKEVQRRFYENTSIYRHKFKLLGQSDGSTMRDYIQNNNDEASELREEKQQLERRYDRYTDKHDELLFDELLDPEDDKVKRVERQRDKTKERIKELIEEISSIEGSLYKDARDKEIEVAKENGAELPPAPNDIIHSKRSSEQDKKKIESRFSNR